MKIAAILLAAGASVRFGGGSKLCAEIDGTPVVRHAAAALAASRIEPIIIVTSGSAEVHAALGPGRWTTAVNPHASEGLASSIACGLAALPAECAGVALALGDMPGVPSALIDELCRVFEAHDGRAVVHPRDASGRQGHPVLWPADLWPELAALRGDHGAKAQLVKHAARVVAVTTASDGAFLDIDTADDLAAARQPTRRR